MFLVSIGFCGVEGPAGSRSMGFCSDFGRVLQMCSGQPAREPSGTIGVYGVVVTPVQEPFVFLVFSGFVQCLRVFLVFLGYIAFCSVFGPADSRSMGFYRDFGKVL